MTDRTWNYKLPGPKDIPVNFRIMFPKNNPNPSGVLQSKGRKLIRNEYKIFHITCNEIKCTFKPA